MPRRDGTGPMGYGEMTGKGLGICNVNNRRNFGFGTGFGRGFRRNKAGAAADSRTEKEWLIGQKDLLEDRLNAVNKRLNNLADSE